MNNIFKTYHKFRRTLVPYVWCASSCKKSIFVVTNEQYQFWYNLYIIYNYSTGSAKMSLLLFGSFKKILMTSSNGNIFRVTGPFCGEFTGPGEFPTQRPVRRSFNVFFDLRFNKPLSKQPWGWWFETLSRSLWRHRNDKNANLLFNCRKRPGIIAIDQGIFPYTLCHLVTHTQYWNITWETWVSLDIEWLFGSLYFQTSTTARAQIATEPNLRST